MNELKIEKTVRFATHGNPKTAKNIWIVLHGYGQLPAFFIRKFHELDPVNNYVIAPEGMHRFYLEGTSGRVGASWMTKEAREHDISDNMNYLNRLWKQLETNFQFENKIVLGFSQGGATAARWHEIGNFNAQHFILWASVFPPDLTFNPQKSTFNFSKNYFVLGDQDPYYDEEKRKEMQRKIDQLEFETRTFKGQHDIDSKTLNDIAKIVSFS